jgi:arginine N-succinyltransferase
MFVVRPIRTTDLDALEKFANSTAVGMLSLPRNRVKLEKKIERSIESFQTAVESPRNELYSFVLEDLKTNELGGVCGFYAKTGINDPNYLFRVETLRQASERVSLPKEITLLYPVIEHNGPSELCMLFLQKSWRKEGLGELLSLSRLLFLADHPERADNSICARLRGFIDKKRNSAPFWDGLGKHFLPIDFQQVETLVQEGTGFIKEWMPSYPIYANLLAKRTQAVIGKTHPTTRPALSLLTREGFSLSSYIDVLDGGPLIKSLVAELRPVKGSRKLTLLETVKLPPDSDRHLASNTLLDYRCCFAHVKVVEPNGIILDRETAATLKVSPGDSVRIVKAH